jgi:hypothetical protein
MLAVVLVDWMVALLGKPTDNYWEQQMVADLELLLA